MADLIGRRKTLFLVLLALIHFRLFLMLLTSMVLAGGLGEGRVSGERKRYSMRKRLPKQIKYVRRLTEKSESRCIENLRMDRNAFSKLCFLLENVGGLTRTKNLEINERVALFLSVLSHHQKMVTIKKDFRRSSWTISKHFHAVLKAVLKLHHILIIRSQPVDESCDNDRWSPFQGCLGALDGTYMKVRVALTEKPKYRNRKGDTSVNVLAVCDTNMNFVYVLSGWEGSAADSRILRNAVARADGLKVPIGNYYLVDCGYANGEGFLSPYRGVRYHLKEFGPGPRAPQNYMEYFNMKHAKARNVIERAFGILKARWSILRSNSFYPIKEQNRIFLACCLLHNFIRTEMSWDPVEDEVEKDHLEEDTLDNPQFIGQVEASPAWTNWRDTLANEMYNRWRGHA